MTAGVRFGAAFWIQRTDWPALRDACLVVEAAGWDSLWFDDHLLSDEADWGDAKLEGWASLAAMAVLTQRVRLGILISAITFRNPGLIAKLATTLDHLSGGRAVLGLGAGWLEREHDAFGFDFGSGFAERLDRLDETAGLIRRLLDGETVTYEGRWAWMHDALCTPRPVQAHLPILIGGSGRTRTMRIVARHADIWNAYGTPASMAELSALLDERCAELGRAPDAIERTVTTHVVVRDTAEAAAAAWAPVARLHGLDERRGPDGTERGLTLGGSPAEVADLVARYREVGIGEVIFVFRSPFDLETIARLPDVRAAVET